MADYEELCVFYVAKGGNIRNLRIKIASVAIISVLAMLSLYSGVQQHRHNIVLAQAIELASDTTPIIEESRTIAENNENNTSQVAEIPTSTPEVAPDTVVIVQPGESLAGIANRYQTTYKRLYDANESIVDPDILAVGMSIRVPRADEQLVDRPLPVKRTQPAPVSTTQPIVPAPAVTDGSVWDRLAACESGGRWNINTGNGYYGGLQFSASTWRGVGGTGLPHEHSREEQILRGQILQARSGWGQWPTCARKLGLL